MRDQSFVGRYAFTVFESDTREFSPDDQVTVASSEELPLLAPLLADGDHEKRIRLGDLCIVVRDDDHVPVALQWINRYSHQDSYLGRLSNPEMNTAYINQARVSSKSRRHGFGRRLMVGSLAVARQVGIDRVRLCVDHRNDAMLGLCRSLGFEEVGHQYGLRLGRFTLRVNDRRPWFR